MGIALIVLAVIAYLIGVTDIISSLVLAGLGVAVVISFRGIHIISRDIRPATYNNNMTDDLLYEYGITDGTPAQQRQHKAESIAAYVAAMAGNAYRESSFGADGTIYYNESVIDQDGNKHITSSGSHAPLTTYDVYQRDDDE